MPVVNRAGFGHSITGDVDLDGNGTPGKPQTLNRVLGIRLKNDS